MRDWSNNVTIGLVAFSAGVAIGYVDSRPSWDDTDITAGSLFICAFLLSLLKLRLAWLVGLAV
ncbi:MAG: hypothetical protein ACK419_07400, partial [Pyrinomonadaceae bacterium]